MGRHARPLGGSFLDADVESAPALLDSPVPAPTGRRRAPQPVADAPSPVLVSVAGRHRAPSIPAPIPAPIPTPSPTPILGRVSAPSEAPDRAAARPKSEVPAPPRGHRRAAAAKRRVPLAVPAVAGVAAIAVTTAGGVALTNGTGGVAMESVAGAGSSSNVERVSASDRAARAEVRTALTAKQADQARSRATALRDARLAAAAAARLAALQKSCGYDPNAQRDEQFTSEMTRNARIIIDVSQRMNLPPRAAVIAIATALQESYLKNMTGGHLDSAGLFQQRPSAGWGSYAQVTNPLYSARKFYTEMLEDVGSAWRRLPLTVVAQDVQVSAFPWAYARWEGMAAEVVSKVLNVPVDSLNCTAR